MSEYTDDEIEEISAIANAFSVIMPDPDDPRMPHKLSGFFFNFRKLIIADYTLDDFMFFWIHDYKNAREIRRILWRYRRLPGHLRRVAKSDKAGRWKLIVSGWMMTYSDQCTPDKVVDTLSHYEALEWDGEFVPTIFVFPRSYSTAISYFDVWTTRPKTFRKIFDLKPGEYNGSCCSYIIK